MLYSVYVDYQLVKAEYILSGVLLNKLGSLNPVFTLFFNSGTADEKLSTDVYEYIMSVRSNQEICTAPFDLWYDSRKIDEIISDDACAVLFDENGNFCRDFSSAPCKKFNYRNMPLSNILEACCPKHRD
jgi:hypothetical protein